MKFRQVYLYNNTYNNGGCCAVCRRVCNPCKLSIIKDNEYGMAENYYVNGKLANKGWKTHESLFFDVILDAFFYKLSINDRGKKRPLKNNEAVFFWAEGEQVLVTKPRKSIIQGETAIYNASPLNPRTRCLRGKRITDDDISKLTGTGTLIRNGRVIRKNVKLYFESTV